MKKPFATCLLNVPAGFTATVRSVGGESHMRGRLCALGITPGSELVMGPEGSCGGTCRVKVRKASLLIDERVARCIDCEYCPGGASSSVCLAKNTV